MSVKTIILIALGLGFLYGLFTIGSPFLLAMIIAIFLESLIVFLIKYGRMKRIAAATVACTLFTLSVLGLFYLLGLKVVSEVVAFWGKAPTYLTEGMHYIRDTAIRTQLLYESLPPDLADQIQSGLNTGIKALTDALNAVLSGISGYFINAAKVIPGLFIYFIVFIVALYLISFSLPRLKSSFLSLFENRSRDKVDEVLVKLRASIFGFLRAQLLLSSMTYVVALAGLLILGVEYPLAIALLIIIVDILPILGTGSFIVPWALYNFAVDNLFLAVGLLILFLVITVFRRIIEPKILGDSIGISALSALVSLYIGFQLVGVVGLFLGPTVIIIYQAMRKVDLFEIKIKFE